MRSGLLVAALSATGSTRSTCPRRGFGSRGARLQRHPRGRPRHRLGRTCTSYPTRRRTRGPRAAARAKVEEEAAPRLAPRPPRRTTRRPPTSRGARGPQPADPGRDRGAPGPGRRAGGVLRGGRRRARRRRGRPRRGRGLAHLRDGRPRPRPRPRSRGYRADRSRTRPHPHAAPSGLRLQPGGRQWSRPRPSSTPSRRRSRLTPQTSSVCSRARASKGQLRSTRPSPTWVGSNPRPGQDMFYRRERDGQPRRPSRRTPCRRRGRHRAGLLRARASVKGTPSSDPARPQRRTRPRPGRTPRSGSDTATSVAERRYTLRGRPAPAPGPLRPESRRWIDGEQTLVDELVEVEAGRVGRHARPRRARPPRARRRRHGPGDEVASTEDADAGDRPVTRSRRMDDRCLPLMSNAPSPLDPFGPRSI